MSLTTTTTTVAASASVPHPTAALASPSAPAAVPVVAAIAAAPRPHPYARPLARGPRTLAASRSTPNLGALFASSSHALAAGPPRRRPPRLLRPLAPPASLAAPTPSSLATIPDAAEWHAADALTETETEPTTPRSTSSSSSSSSTAMAPLTPGRFASSVASYAGNAAPPPPGDDVAVGDTVDVPGGMAGTVRFVGAVAGRKGVFAGVELHPEFAARGKNSGDVDGVAYFNTSVPGAGIFLPLSKAVRRDGSPGAAPMTPTAAAGLKLGSQNSTNYTPPTPSLPKFSQSVSGALPPARAPSPQQGARRPPRTSLPRPDSPVRRLQMTPGPGRPSLSTPAPKTAGVPATGAGGAGGAAIAAAGPGRFGSPTSTSKFSQSMRAPSTAGIGDPSKRGVGGGGGGGGGSNMSLFGRSVQGGPGFGAGRKASIGPRSASALGGASNYGDDDDIPMPLGGVGGANVRSIAPKSSGYGGGMGRPPSRTASSRPPSRTASSRPPSRTAGHVKHGSGSGSGSTTHAHDDEVQRLRAQLEDRERQLKDQASTLADMESSLTELQTLIESSDGPLGVNGGLPAAPPHRGAGGAAAGGGGHDDGGELDGSRDVAQLRALLREKNDKIAMLTAEFDVHRADFRSTIDTLEMASTETERVYEKKIEELMQENQELESRLADVDAVAHQLKQLEELVQELEEGLEDARRGEAEARGEVEFLRGEVERTRTELRREREKAAAMMAGGAMSPTAAVSAAASAAAGLHPKDLEQKDDEIRGLKAIIHSLSQNAGAGDGGGGSSGKPGHAADGPHRRGESINERLARETLEREVAELRSLLDAKSSRELDMERELDQLRSGALINGSANGNGNANANANANGNANGSMHAAPAATGHRTSAMTVGSRSSLRDSRGTVVLAREYGAPMGSGGGGGGAGHMHSRSSSYSKPRAAVANGNGSSNGNGHNTSSMNMNGSGNGTNAAAHGSGSGSRSPEAPRKMHHVRGPTLDTMPESDAYSSVTDSSTLWCEICETSGHDILTCTNMFGPGAATRSSHSHQNGAAAPAVDPRTGRDVVRAALAEAAAAPPAYTAGTVKTVVPTGVPPEVRILPNPMESGPVAGKESGVVDAGKWCALCERDGHDSVDCPFEDAF